MGSHLDSDAVQYVCDCQRPSRINKLFFCRHCLKLRCGRCACTQVDSFFCSSCLENIPSAEAKFAVNRCTKCFDCPSCQHTLTSRAAKPPPAAVAAPADAGDSLPPASNAAAEKEAAKRKVYYLICSACRWTSRDVGIPDRPVATGQWPDLEYAHATRFETLLDHSRNVVLHDKQTAQDWARRKGAGQPKYASLSDRTGLTVAIARRTLGWSSEKSTPKRIIKPVDLEPSVATAGVPELPAELLTEPLDLVAVTTLRQRLHLPAVQPHTVDALHPARKSLSIKRSVRCNQCEHFVIKPEFNPASIKYRIHSLASGHVPVVRLMQPVPKVLAGTESALPVRLKFINPTAHEMRITLHRVLDAARWTAELELPGDGDQATFAVQRRDDATEFDGELTLPDETPFVVWRRSNAVVVLLHVRPMRPRRGDRLSAGLRLSYTYVNAYPAASAAVAALDASGAAGKKPADGPVEHTLNASVQLTLGEVQ